MKFSLFDFNTNIFFLFIPILFPAAADEISPGSTLLASNPKQSWKSPNRAFAFSFIEQSPNAFFAAITHNGVPIWKAAAAVDSSAELRFLPDGNLRLVSGGASAWQSNTSGLGITSASLENSGNFVLRNRGVSIWSTFDHPADTILPGQNFTVDHVLTCGLYSFHLLTSGQITLRWNSTVEYYRSSGINTTAVLRLSSPTLGIQSIGVFSVSGPSLTSGPVVMARSNDYGDESTNTLRFVKLDCDGNLRIYSSSGIGGGGGGEVSVTWKAISDQCQVFGYCGGFGICRYNEFDLDPYCECPSKNFVRVDPKDSRMGCRRRADIRSCQTTMLPLDNTLFMTFPPEIESDVVTANIVACSANCLQDPSCVASTSLADGTGFCYMKRSGFVSAYRSPTLTSTSFVKVCGPVMPNPSTSSHSEGGNYEKVELAVVALGSGLVVVVLVGLFWWFCMRPKRRYESLHSRYSFSDYTSGVPVRFSYKELRKGTNGFKEKLGEGGFGSVYKGVVASKLTVAVKNLEGIGQGEKQFRMEVATISSTHHLNLVRLIGFCSEGRHRLLVYEFMKNSSLDTFLFPSQESKKHLNWECRYNIASGTAKGLAYLHEECRDCILHCDVKPENILLDDNFNPRISDFGLAKLLSPNDFRHQSLVRGTRGYLAPEWVANLAITTKADVYGYGMVLLEIVSGRRNFEVSSEKKFWVWAYEEFEKGNVGSVLDRRLREEEVDMDEAVRAIRVAFLCVQEQPELRPTMAKVVQMLAGMADVDKPKPPFGVVESVGGVCCVSSSSGVVGVVSE